MYICVIKVGNESRKTLTAERHKIKTMKKLFFLRAADASSNGNGGGTTAPVVPIEKVYTSDKLTELTAKFDAAYDSMAAIKDTKARQNAMLETFKIQKEIDAEIAGLKQADREAELQMKRNERIALVDTLLADHAAVLALPAKATDADKQAANDKLAASRETVQNELLGRYAASTPSKTATGEKATGGTKGAVGAEIVALHQANLAAGKTPTESKKMIVDGGHSRGTTGAVILAWEKEQGMK